MSGGIKIAVHIGEDMAEDAPIELHFDNRILKITPECARLLIERLEAYAKYTEEWREWRISDGCN